MPDENPTPDEPEFDVLDRETIYLMTNPSLPSVWSLADIGREIETHDPEAIVRPLVNVGLLYRLGDFVFAAPAAFKMVQMVGRVV
jgi:hypothetical protein